MPNASRSSARGGLDGRLVGERGQQLVVLAAAERVVERGAVGDRHVGEPRRERPRRSPRTSGTRSIARPSETSIIAVAPCAGEHAPLPDPRRRSQVPAHQQRAVVRPGIVDASERRGARRRSRRARR